MKTVLQKLRKTAKYEVKNNNKKLGLSQQESKLIIWKFEWCSQLIFSSVQLTDSLQQKLSIVLAACGANLAFYPNAPLSIRLIIFLLRSLTL